MTYVDDAFIPFGRMLMSHMVADTHDELMAMAKQIGVDLKWIQNWGKPDEHFDIAKGKRTKAIECGAKEVTSQELVEVIRRKR